jgi:small-conductance mechanosensitive channel
MFEQYISNDLLRASVLFMGFFIILRLGFALFKNVFLKISKRTKSDLDDILIEKLNWPANVFILLISLAVGFSQPEFLSVGVLEIINKILISLGVLTIAVLIYTSFDIIISRLWGNVSRIAKVNVDNSLTDILHTIMRIVFIALAIVYILEIWGVEIGPLLAGLGIAGLAVALALQPTLSNIFSGIAMILDKTIKVGDLVYLDSQTKGTIEKVGIRSTRIRTFDNELLILPNSKLADSMIQNVALPEKKSRATVPFGVAYGSDIDKVKKLVLAEIGKIKHVLDDPKPTVRFLEMANSSLNFKVYYYVASYENRFGTIDEANTRIYNALNKAGIEIPFPQMDVHIKK